MVRPFLMATRNRGDALQNFNLFQLGIPTSVGDLRACHAKCYTAEDLKHSAFVQQVNGHECIFSRRQQEHALTAMALAAQLSSSLTLAGSSAPPSTTCRSHQNQASSADIVATCNYKHQPGTAKGLISSETANPCSNWLFPSSVWSEFLNRFVENSICWSLKSLRRWLCSHDRREVLHVVLVGWLTIQEVQLLRKAFIKWAWIRRGTKKNQQW